MLQQSKNQIVNKTIKRLLSSAVLMSLPFTMAAAKDNQELIDLARQEAQQGTFEIMVSSPKGERAQRKLMEEFQKRFDLDLDWDWSPLTSTVSAPRVHQQATSGLAVPSAIGGYGYNTYEHWFARDRKSTRLNSSHVAISYAVFCLKKKKELSNVLLHFSFVYCLFFH